jgi:hypothetical protein
MLFASNPVKPGFDGNVTIDGLTDQQELKQDIEGNLVLSWFHKVAVCNGTPV